MTQHELRHAREAEDIGLELATHFVHWNFFDGAVAAVAGVVEQHADRAFCFIYRGNCRLHGVFVADVEPASVLQPCASRSRIDSIRRALA